MKKFLLVLCMMAMVFPVHGLENGNIKYKYYRLNKVLGPIVSKDEVNEEYPLLDEDNPIKGELSDLSAERPEEKDGREIYEYEGYRYLKVPKIDSIEIQMNDNSNLYNINFTNIYGDISVTSDNDGNLSSNEVGNFWLDEPIDYEDLLMSAVTKDGEEFNSFMIYFKSNNTIVSSIDVLAVPNLDHYIYGNQAILREDTVENVYSIDELHDSDLIYKGKVKLYQFTDYKYQSYKLEKEYYPEYLNGPLDDYRYRDDSDYIIEKIDTNLTAEEPMLEISNSFTDKQPMIDNLKKENSLVNSNDDTKNIKTKPSQYQQVLKTNNKKTSSNKVDNSNMYIYFSLVILIILLLLMWKIRNRLKMRYR